MKKNSYFNLKIENNNSGKIGVRSSDSIDIGSCKMLEIKVYYSMKFTLY